MRLFWRQQQSKTTHTVKTHYKDVFDCIICEGRLDGIVRDLGSSIIDIYALARVNKQLWTALADDHELWRALYLDNDPIVVPDIR